MNTRSFIALLQTFLGATKSELTVVAVILAGLCAGVILRAFNGDFTTHNSALDAAEVDRLADSIAAVELSTYTGITPAGEAVPELAAGDTIAAHDEHFPAQKKALPNAPVDINTATKEQLMAVPGIGPSTAEKIVAARGVQPFRRPEDIMRVKGIGVKKFEAMRRYIVAGNRQQQSK